MYLWWLNLQLYLQCVGTIVVLIVLTNWYEWEHGIAVDLVLFFFYRHSFDVVIRSLFFFLIHMHTACWSAFHAVQRSIHRNNHIHADVVCCSFFLLSSQIVAEIRILRWRMSGKKVEHTQTAQLAPHLLSWFMLLIFIFVLASSIPFGYRTIHFCVVARFGLSSIRLFGRDLKCSISIFIFQ